MNVLRKARGWLLLGLLGAVAVAVAGLVSNGTGTVQAFPDDSDGCPFDNDGVADVNGDFFEACLAPTAHITKVVSDTSVALGDFVAYTIVVWNDADGVTCFDITPPFGVCGTGFTDPAARLDAFPMENVVITDDVDTEFAIGSATWFGQIDFFATGGNATVTGNHVQLNINNAIGCGSTLFACHLHDVDSSATAAGLNAFGLPFGDQVVLTITGAAVSCGISANTARVSATGTSATAVESGVAVACANLELTKTGPEEVAQGQQATYTITVKNTGTLQADDVVVVDQLPTGIAGDPAVSQAAGVSGGTVTVQLGDIVAGGSKSFTIAARADGSCDSNQTNTATASSPSGLDEDLTDNTAAVTTKITCAPAEEAAGPVVPTGDSGLLAGEGSLASWQMALLSLLAVSALGGAYYGFRRISR